MTRIEAAQVMAHIKAAWPTVPFAEDNMQVWFSAALEQCPLEVGERVAIRIIREDQWFPTPARFNELRRADTPSRPAPPPPSLPSGERRATPEFVKNIIAEMRETLANAKGPLAKDLRRTSVVEHTPAAEPPGGLLLMGQVEGRRMTEPEVPPTGESKSDLTVGGSATLPDAEWAARLSASDCVRLVHGTLEAGDVHGTVMALRLLAVKDPSQAEEMLQAVNAGIALSRGEKVGVRFVAEAL